MADMTLSAFEEQVTSACATAPIIVSVAVMGIGVTWLRLRAHLADGSFVDAFYNEMTGKTAYALIKDGRRIFGADNTGSWHWHPFDAPNSHTLVASPITFQEFLSRIEEHLELSKTA